MNSFSTKFTANLEKSERLDIFLRNNLSNISRNKIVQYIQNSCVKVNDNIVTSPKFLVKINDIVTWNSSQHDQHHIETNSIIPNKNIELHIIFEDEDIIILNKQANLTVHPGAGNYNDTLVNGLMAYFDSLSQKNSMRPGIVHRLDRDTTGLMIIAKNDFAHTQLAKSIAKREVSRKYIAFTEGTLTPHIGRIDLPIIRDSSCRTKMTIDRYLTNPQRKEAITHYKILRTFISPHKKLQFSKIECSLETGRTHQIRVHLSKLQKPILGDMVYNIHGKNKYQKFIPLYDFLSKELTRQALHAYYLEFSHPRTKEILTFTLPLPNDLQKLEEILVSYEYTT